MQLLIVPIGLRHQSRMHFRKRHETDFAISVETLFLKAFPAALVQFMDDPLNNAKA